MITVEFGSRMRGDYDASSDRDLLIIGDRWPQLIEASSDMRWRGYSISRFTYDRATYLISTGSLFFKHIAEEGTLVEGSAVDFQELLGAWKPASNYRQEIEENVDLLDLLEFMPRSLFGLSVAVDIIFTALRSVLIRELAGEGFYLFSWTDILEKAELMGWIIPSDKSLFLRARRLKNSYRRGQNPRIDGVFFNLFSQAALRALRTKRQPQWADRGVIYKLPDRFPDNSYKQLRALELLCGEFNCDDSIGHIRQWVKEPSYFCSGRIPTSDATSY